MQYIVNTRPQKATYQKLTQKQSRKQKTRKRVKEGEKGKKRQRKDVNAFTIFTGVVPDTGHIKKAGY